MILDSVTIKGFRNIKKVTLNFDGITSIISLNNYGKSNILKAIDFSINFIKAENILRRKMMGWRRGIPLNKMLEANNFMVDFRFSKEINNIKYKINYGFEFIWDKDDNTGKRIIKEWLRIKEDRRGHRFYELVRRNFTEGYYRTRRNTSCNKRIKVKDDELVLDLLLKQDELYYYPIIIDLFNVKVYLDEHLDASNLFEEDFLVLRNGKKFDINAINNIPRIVYYLKEEHISKFNLLIDAFCKLFPNITDIIVREHVLDTPADFNIPDNLPYTISDKVYTMYVKDRNLNQAINIEELSEGTKRIFLLLTHLTIATINNITLIALEEPENCIHPKLLQQLVILMDILSGDCKIIISSHSPYILDCVDTSNVYVGKPNNYGLADFAKIKDKKIKILYKDAEKYSSSIGQYIFELLSGNELDFEMLFDYLENDYE